MHPMQRLVLLQLNGVLASRATLVMVGPCVLRQTLWRPRGWTLLCPPLDAVVGHVHKSDPLCLLTGGGLRMGRRGAQLEVAAETLDASASDLNRQWPFWLQGLPGLMQNHC